jgi:hypothetical protein
MVIPERCNAQNNVIIIKTKVHLSRVNVAIVDVLLSCLDSLVCLCRTHVQLYIYIFIIFSSIFAYNLNIFYFITINIVGCNQSFDGLWKPKPDSPNKFVFGLKIDTVQIGYFHLEHAVRFVPSIKLTTTDHVTSLQVWPSPDAPFWRIIVRNLVVRKAIYEDFLWKKCLCKLWHGDAIKWTQ